jgi:deoxyribodipyrimidine photo-lyase
VSEVLLDKQDKAIVWFRQDLRLIENPAFLEACLKHDKILPLYILDDTTQNLGAAQRWWLHHSLVSLDTSLQKLGLKLCLRRGQPLLILQELVNTHKISALYWNRCYEPSSIARDTAIKAALQKCGISVKSSNSSLLSEPWEIKTVAGDFFKVFTPFWRAAVKNIKLPEFAFIDRKINNIICETAELSSWQLLPSSPNWAGAFHDLWQPGESGAQIKLRSFLDSNLHGYAISRDIPAKNTTSKLSPHLHFGEISPWQIYRELTQAKLASNADLPAIERFLAELGWREFSYHLLYHFPSLPEKNFRANFDGFPWQQDLQVLKKWQQGKTGYPIVDAGMRELWQTGYMQNRVRMITASFLIKDLLISWQTGASWFWDTLLDADLANNSASWQWVAGSGADAAPYFRIFNPVLQGEKFDPLGEYVKKWVPELKNIPLKWLHKPWLATSEELGVLRLGQDYPYPIVDHAKARQIALQYYHALR